MSGRVNKGKRELRGPRKFNQGSWENKCASIDTFSI